MTAVWRTDLDSFALTLCHKEEDAKIYFKYEYIMAGTAGELW